MSVVEIIKEHINHPNMEYFRYVYKNSKHWDGKEDLTGKKVIIYGCQGFGDQIQFLRFVRFLQAMDCHITLHAPKALHRMISSLGVGVIEKEPIDLDEKVELPNHDFHILSLSLPFVLNIPVPLEPYIAIPEKTELLPGFNIGIAWEGSEIHEYNAYRNCPLKYFKAIQKSGVNLWMLNPKVYNYGLTEGAEEMDINGTKIEDFYDTGKLLNSLDLVVTVDTAVLHMAGAMGKKGYALLSPEAVIDPRWCQRVWYPTINLIKGDWQKALERVADEIPG